MKVGGTRSHHLSRCHKACYYSSGPRLLALCQPQLALLFFLPLQEVRLLTSLIVADEGLCSTVTCSCLLAQNKLLVILAPFLLGVIVARQQRVYTQRSAP